MFKKHSSCVNPCGVKLVLAKVLTRTNLTLTRLAALYYLYLRFVPFLGGPGLLVMSLALGPGVVRAIIRE